MSDQSVLSEAGIPIIYSRILLSAARRHAGALRESVQEGAGEGFMSLAQYAGLLKRARQLTDDPLIALRAGADIPFSVHGPVGIAAMSAATLHDALEVICRFANLRSPFCHIRRKEQDASLALELDIDQALGEQADAALDFIVATLCRSILRAIEAPLSGGYLELCRPAPAMAQDYAHLLGCPVRFGRSRNALVLKCADLSIGLLGANQEVYVQAIDQLQRISSLSRRRTSMREGVSQVFMRQSGQICGLDDAARALNLSVRTLQRRLASEGISFHALREQWLAAQALAYLQHEGLSVEVTATLLGYSETANFRRSFRRWFGMPPSEYCAGVK